VRVLRNNDKIYMYTQQCKSMSFICIFFGFNNNKCFPQALRRRLFIFQIITNFTRPMKNILADKILLRKDGKEVSKQIK